jgi:predicted double-glycine peptidase
MKTFIFLILIFIPLFSYNKIIENKPNIKKPKNSWIEIRNKNLVNQKFDYSCGSASLATILKYFYKQEISEIEILDIILSQNNLKEEDSHIMFSFLDLANVAKQKGFKAFSLNLNFNMLKKLKIPAILYVIIRKEPHFTVFKKIDNNNIYLADPSFGNITIPIKKFKEMFFVDKQFGKILLIIPKHKTPINFAFKKIEQKDPTLFNRYNHYKILTKELSTL